MDNDNIDVDHESECLNRDDDPTRHPQVCFWIPQDVLSLSWPTESLDVSSVGDIGNVMMGMAQAKAMAASTTSLVPQETIERLISFNKTSKRVIYDLQFTKEERHFPGVLMRSEGEGPIHRPGDDNVNTCYENIGITLAFFSSVFGRTSLDGQGTPIIGIVNYDFYFPNAWWGPVTFDAAGRPLAFGIVFGNGFDHDPFKNNAPRPYFAGQVGRLVTSLQCVAHELGHGVTMAMQPNVVRKGQAGALDEHWSDVFGALVEQWHRQQSAEESDWMVGKEVVLPSHQGMGLRSMKHPGKAFSFGDIAQDHQRDHMDNLFTGPEDRGGVHLNSGIPNRAFYELSMRIGGYAWEKAGMIWYKALQKKLPDNCSFVKWASVTHSVAQKEFGADIAAMVKDAWKVVGINI